MSNRGAYDSATVKFLRSGASRSNKMAPFVVVVRRQCRCFDVGVVSCQFVCKIAESVEDKVTGQLVYLVGSVDSPPAIL